MNALQRVLGALTVYLPVGVLALLALGSYFLARNTPGTWVAPTVAAPRHVPDYFMRDFSVRSFDAHGMLKSEVSGSELRHYPDTDTTEVDNPRIRMQRPGGAVMIGTAKRAISNADGSEVQLIGNAVVVREPSASAPQRLEIRGEFLHAFVSKDLLKSPQAVTLQRGADVLSAGSLVYDNAKGVAEMGGRARGSFTSKP
jgi:lipopolysaccharide export system protein LptC